MKKVLLLALALVLCFTLALTACQTHECQHKCETCGKCTSDCTDPVCADKCTGHQPAHVCQHKCEICGKCTDATCPDPVCADKCAGHVQAIPVEQILVNTDDETHEGTLTSPLDVVVSQGKTTEVTFSVLPQNATDKAVNWKVGIIADGTFAEDATAKVAVSVSGSRLVITAEADAVGNLAIRGKANNGDAEVYLNVIVDEFIPMTAIRSNVLAQSEEEGIDYQLTTAAGVNWNMDLGITARGQELLDGNIFGGLQKPVNITYFAGAYNLGLNVEPENATDKSLQISYSTSGIVDVNEQGAITVLAAGETVVTIASFEDPSVKVTIKVTVVDSLYRGITKDAYDNATVSSRTSWDLDPSDDLKGQTEHMACYNEWNLVMVHSNLKNTASGIDNNQKIFYMGSGEKPYGICLENNVGSNSGASLLDSASLTWAKIAIPEHALTFNVKLNNNDKTHGEYRVVFVEEDGTATVLTDGWQGFASSQMPSFTIKLDVPETIKGKTGAMVIEHRVTEADNNAELHLYKMSFEGQIDVTGVKFEKSDVTYQVGAREFSVSAKVLPENATNDKVTYAMKEGSAEGVTVDGNGIVTVSETAQAGTYVIVAKAAADATKTAEFTLTLVTDIVEILTWENKSEILDEARDPWTIVGDTDRSVGEGADIIHTGSYLFNQFVIGAHNAKLTFGARVFVRSGETYPDVQLHVIEVGSDTPVIIKARGQASDTINIVSDDVLYYSYNLTQFIGKTVEIRIVVINNATHCVIANIKMEAQPENEPDVIEVEQLNLAKEAETLTLKGEPLTYQISAKAKPANATDTTVRYELATSATGISVDENGLITIATDAVAGVYTINVKAGSITKAFTLTLTANEVEVNSWNNKSELLDGVSGVKWVVIGGYNEGAGEGIDLSTRLGSGAGKEYSAAQLANRKVKSSSFIMYMSIRTFPNEKTQEIVVKVTDAEGKTTVISTIGGTAAIPDNNPANNGKIDTYTYDLSAYIGQTVTIECGVTGECYHAVITSIRFNGNAEDVRTWANKSALLDEAHDGWTVNGQWNSGAGEGIDLQGANSYVSNTFVIGNYNATFTFGGRIFVGQEGDKGQPNVKLVVVCDGVETVVRANGADGDTITLNSDNVTSYSYDLSQFVGKKVEIRIVCEREVYHCVIANVAMTAKA